MERAKRLAAAATIATALAVPMEGLRQWAYYDPPGILTVCYGSTKNVVKGKKYSIEECKLRLNTDMMEAVETVERCVPGLPVHSLAAFADAVYNMGPTITCSTAKSTAARLLAAGKVEEACRQLPKWNKAKVAGVFVALPGLTKRRNAEMELCLQGDA
jgi:GH24 family phage-related lysozyme (muramidase)